MGYEELIRDLHRESGLRREGLLQAAREEARQITEDSTRQCERMERDFLDSMARDLERERTRLLSRARREVQVLQAGVRSELVRLVFDGLEKRLQAVPSGKQYPSVLERLLDEALPECPEGEIVVRADAATRTLLKSIWKDRAVRFEPFEKTPKGEDPWGGFELSNRDGSFVIRNTFRSRLEKARPELLVEMNRLLFGEVSAK